MAFVEARKRGGLLVAVAVIGCAAIAVLAVGLNSGNLLERTGSIELLCSDGRCGEGSKLTRQNAVKDLDKWADKAELKDRLDELQTVMERGMTHKSAAKQLDKYFDRLDRTVQQQKLHALKQARGEGMDLPVLSSRKHQATSLHSSQNEETSDDSADDSEAQDDNDVKADSTDSHEEHHSKSAAHKETDDSSSAAALNKYFDKQAAKIQEENKQQLHSSKLTAAQADADLNSYFDSISASTKKSKIQAVEKKLDNLDNEVQIINFVPRLSLLLFHFLGMTRGIVLCGLCACQTSFFLWSLFFHPVCVCVCELARENILLV
jgi:hypothetical protein